MTGRSIRVATFNVHGCVGMDGRYAPDRIADAIEAVTPDVIGLQEVDNRRPWHEGFHQFDYLRHRTGLQAIPGASIVEERGDYGNALFTRLPVIEVRRINISVSGREPRGAIDALLDTGRTAVRVISTHLGLRPAERHHQIDRLLAALDEGGGEPTLLIGDFNEWLPFSLGLRRLAARFDAGYAGRTWPSQAPLLALDRIYATPHPDRARLRVHRSPTLRRASDHLPLSVDLAWPADAKRRRP